MTSSKPPSVPPGKPLTHPIPRADSPSPVSSGPSDPQTQKISLERLFPFPVLLETLNIPLLRWVLIFALFPLAAGIYFSNYVDIEKATWAMGLYFAVLWAFVIRSLIGLESFKIRNIVVPAIFTPIVGIFLVLLLQKFPIMRQLYDAADPKTQYDPFKLLGFVGGVGLLEEGVKILPIFWLCFYAKEIDRPKNAAFYAAISGLSFGIPEAVQYSLQIAEQNAIFTQQTGIAGSGNYIISQFLRVITLPLLHAAFSGIVGFYMSLALNKPTQIRTMLIIGLAAGALLHGLYDFFAGSWLGLLVAAVSIWLFIGLARSDSSASERIIDSVPSS
jgi:protease PrsW